MSAAAVVEYDDALGIAILVPLGRIVQPFVVGFSRRFRPVGQFRRLTAMRRVACAPRPNLDARANELGFTFAKINGETILGRACVLWFSLEEIERDLEEPSADLQNCVWRWLIAWCATTDCSAARDSRTRVAAGPGESQAGRAVALWPPRSRL